MSENYGQIGKNITDTLKAKGKTQLWLAQESGINAANISKYMNGFIVPSLYNAVRICMALDIDMNTLVKGWIDE